MKLRLTRPVWLALAFALAAFAVATASRAAESAPASPATLAPVAPAAIDALFAKWDRPTSPGCALAVIHDGRIIYQRGYGSADLEHDLPISSDTVFYVGSVSKQFTAACIALLAQGGKLSLDDDVRKYVPELPDYGATITVRHLVHHTSGLRDYLELRSLAGEPSDAPFSDAEVLALVLRQKALNFPTGTQYLYSNTGYFLLSQIVKRVSGKSLRDYAAENIFQPLGMTTAQFRDDHTALVKHRAQGYSPRGQAFRLDNPNFDVVGAGGVFMTVGDFLRWNENFYSGKVGGADFVRLLQTPGKLNDGTPIKPTPYAFGLMITTRDGREVVTHDGAYGGFRATTLRFPQERLSVVCLCNLSTMQPGQLALDVANLYLNPAKPAASGSPAAKQSKTKAAAPAPASSTPSTAPTAAPVETGASSTTAKWNDYLGDFLSDELQSTFTFRLVSGKLVLHGGRRNVLTLTPSGVDTFTAASWQVKFSRDSTGRVTGFTLDAGRVRNLQFARR